MYYVNREQIDHRLNALPDVADALETLAADWQGTVLQGLAQERALHLAVEIVTDVGSYLIDGFIMRDASSYEDIIDIIGEEGVFPAERKAPLAELVRLRKPLVQDYWQWDRAALHPLTPRIPDVLRAFRQDVVSYLERELG
ncbi:MAG: DUF86 domain-containing protein [Thermobacillus sp.]|uniref:DUF86 domain-containing protein n=1 Tax=Thermobacillus composti (strain DSM 18247 / JCM 13945 / KWC4) TaxID=717605 RepID=L0ECX4_THECK|nr:MULTISPECIES: HepT-like ribonuclease domain-containing protein [Thermobacillus]AGA57541.1 hypothetical protein Theco_1386 [Thermobacillus composti KWC4]REJ21676.1 MAG: DUF86 domain-containing protein [Paenibacillaceae bacterium]REK59466.1 MAG: DUF86 domain-containing protein [Thermobacillus sp.]